MTFPLPRPVRPGSHRSRRARRALQRRGFLRDSAGCGSATNNHRPDIFAKTGNLAGDNSPSHLFRAARSPRRSQRRCDGLARGGFGTTRILPGIGESLVHAANKLVIGFSDITALHAIWAEAGVRSVQRADHHSPGPGRPRRKSGICGSIPSNTTARLGRGSYPGSIPAVTTPAAFTGGNLAVLGALLGTEHQPRLSGRILFIEDVGDIPAASIASSPR